jgi:uncharacterized protein (TIGR02246 family)
MTADALTIWRVIQASNRAWLEGRPEDVASLFSEDVVVVVQAEVKARGRAAVVQSYVDYCRHVVTHAFSEGEYSVEVFGDTAASTYCFTVKYEAGGVISHERGQEILLFRRRDGRWQAFWRTQIFLGPAA